MPDLYPTPKPLGAIDFAEELEDAVISTFQAHIYLGDSANVSTIRRAYPQGDDRPGPFTSPELPIIEVGAKRTGVEAAATAAQWFEYEVIIDVVSEHGQRRTGIKTNERIRDEAVTALTHSSVDGSSSFLSSGNQVFVEGISPGDVETASEDNPNLFWSRSTVSFRVLWFDPAVT